MLERGQWSRRQHLEHGGRNVGPLLCTVFGGQGGGTPDALSRSAGMDLAGSGIRVECARARSRRHRGVCGELRRWHHAAGDRQAQRTPGSSRSSRRRSPGCLYLASDVAAPVVGTVLEHRRRAHSGMYSFAGNFSDVETTRTMMTITHESWCARAHAVVVRDSNTDIPSHPHELTPSVLTQLISELHPGTEVSRPRSSKVRNYGDADSAGSVSTSTQVSLAVRYCQRRRRPCRSRFSSRCPFRMTSIAPILSSGRCSRTRSRSTSASGAELRHRSAARTGWGASIRRVDDSCSFSRIYLRVLRMSSSMMDADNLAGVRGTARDLRAAACALLGLEPSSGGGPVLGTGPGRRERWRSGSTNSSAST